MFKKLALVAAVAVFVTGCASVPMASKEASDQVKRFDPPAQGQAGLYIYRGSGLGAALKKDIWVDGKCIGESAPNVFFYEAVAGGREYTIATDSEFSPNEIKLPVASGNHYFIKQYMKPGVFVGGANLEVVDEATGKAAIRDLLMATKGTCSK